MKLKKTLVMLLAACMTAGTIAGTAFADGDFTIEETPAVVSPVLPADEAYIPGAALGAITIVDATGKTMYSGILKELATPYTGWDYVDDNWAYYRNGKLQYHWQQIDGKWYYFNEYGIMLKRGVAWIENRLFYFDENGVCDTTPGWKLVPDFYYVYETDTSIKTVYPAAGFSWFYLNQNGYIQTGWNYIDGTWHMCDKYTGRMLCNEWYKGEGGYWYYFDEFTDMATGWMTVKDPYKTNRTYYFNNSGVLQWGWLNLGGNWYYLNPKNAARVENSWAMIDGPEGKYWYLFDEDGVMQTGWQVVCVQEEKKDDKGKVTQPAVYEWFYLNSWGAMETGQRYVSGNWYDFGDDGTLDLVWNGYFWEAPSNLSTWELTPGEGTTEGPVPGAVIY